MKTIWKFPLTLASEQRVVMPTGAKVLSVNEIAGELFIWAEVKPKNQPSSRRVYIFGTGHLIDLCTGGKPLEYVGTVLQNYGVLVWHVYVEGL